MSQTLSAQEGSAFRSLLMQAINSNVEIITNFGSLTGEVVQTGSVIKIPLNYVVLRQTEKDFVYIPLGSIDSVIIINEEGDLS